MEASIKPWTAKRKTGLVIAIIQGKTTVAEVSQSFDLSPFLDRRLGRWRKKAMGNSLQASPLDIREQYEKQLKHLQEPYSEAMLERRAWEKLQTLLGQRTIDHPEALSKT